MWLVTEYEAVTLFSLKISTATASGGKTLLAPTPYAIKMALLDAACRTVGVAKAKSLWPQIRDLQVAIRPARRIVVTNLFQKVLRPRRNPLPFDQPEAGPFQKSIGYREYAQMEGSLGIALGWNEDDTRTWLEDLALNISYFGKRGGFVQVTKTPEISSVLSSDFVPIEPIDSGFSLNGTLQIMDDCGPKVTFDQVNIYSSKSMKLGKDRILHHVILPYRLTRSSRGYSLYERID